MGRDTWRCASNKCTVWVQTIEWAGYTWRVQSREFDTQPITLIADNAIAQFNPTTGGGLINKKGTTALHLSRAFGARRMRVPDEIVDEILALEPEF